MSLSHQYSPNPYLVELPRQLSAIANHPLNRDRPFRAIGRWLRWQIGSRLVPGEVLVPFVDDTVLVARPGLTGVTSNSYYGLYEFEDMSFTLQLLRPKDLFIDVGANCGSYTVLASGAVGATTIAFEPVPAAADLLDLKVRANGLADCVTVRRCGVAAEPGKLPFTMDQDTTNHVATSGEAGEMIPVETLDRALERLAPTLIKIDVEGFEVEVLRGSQKIPHTLGLKALIVENSPREEDVMSVLREAGFQSFAYDPMT